MLADASQQGDLAAIVELASWSIAGNIIPRNLGAARSLLAQAGNGGDEAAGLLHASFLASGTGGPADWPSAVAQLRQLEHRSARARAQLNIVDRMNLDSNGFPAGGYAALPLCGRPAIQLCREFLQPAECNYLSDLGGPFLQPSVVVDPSNGRAIPHPIRLSDGAAFGVFLEDLVVAAINRRVARLTDTQYEQGEPLQLLRYHRGGEYRPHLDALPGEPNQRIKTVILYLNQDYRGGETRFPKVDLSWAGKTGDALMFDNVDADGRADNMALHAGAPVSNGTKLIASRWIRANAFKFPPPRSIIETFNYDGRR
ncbi:putative eukaryotic Peptidyl prolyl 4-hydroxylase, alpha subunit [Sphingomonas sp. AX6]|nr:putative eukaryotic Peptidyl prolyl 4-hydroxylase, alpha subunit [Sphingomonas sp. AX6]